MEESFEKSPESEFESSFSEADRAFLQDLEALSALRELALEAFEEGRYPFVRPEAIDDLEELEWFRAQVAVLTGVGSDQIHLRSLHEAEDLYMMLEVRSSREGAHPLGQLVDLSSEMVMVYRPSLFRVMVEGLQEPRFFRCDRARLREGDSPFGDHLIVEVSQEDLAGMRLASEQHDGLDFFDQEGALVDRDLVDFLHMDLSEAVNGHEDFSPGDRLSVLQTPQGSIVYRVCQSDGKAHWYHINGWLEKHRSAKK